MVWFYFETVLGSLIFDSILPVYFLDTLGVLLRREVFFWGVLERFNDDVPPVLEAKSMFNLIIKLFKTSNKQTKNDLMKIFNKLRWTDNII